jgi:hypothetical protein
VVVVDPGDLDWCAKVLHAVSRASSVQLTARPLDPSTPPPSGVHRGPRSSGCT